MRFLFNFIVPVSREDYFLKTLSTGKNRKAIAYGTAVKVRKNDFCWGFCAVICCTLGLAAFLMFSAWGRFSGVAWGGLVDKPVSDVSEDGFICVEIDPSEEQATVSAPVVASLPDKRNPSEQPVSGKAVVLPDKASSLPLPQKKASEIPLPTPVPNETVQEDFGPLPRDLSDFESIVLSTEENGMSLPDDLGIDISDLDLPEDEITLSNVGASWKEHVVKTGETLSDIAILYGGVTAQDILRANGLKDANRLAAKQILLVPDSEEFIEDTLEEVRTRQARIVALREEVKPLKVSVYLVTMGDSLWSIANSQNVELDTLVGSNTFKSSTLQPGLALRIPNQDGIFYKMKQGDSAASVAKRYQVSLDRVKKVNPTVDLVSLKPGDEMFLPGARPEAVAESKAANVKKSPSTSQKVVASKGSSSAKVSSSSSSRLYRWPVMGRINSPFGWRRHPITRRRDFHTGIDIKASRGVSVKSARDGKVVYAGWMGGYGKVAVVDHGNGESTFYAHCSQLFVSQGKSVRQGDVVGSVGTTGRSTGPHLHFEVRKGNSPVNPLQFLR